MGKQKNKPALSGSLASLAAAGEDVEEQRKGEVGDKVINKDENEEETGPAAKPKRKLSKKTSWAIEDFKTKTTEQGKIFSAGLYQNNDKLIDMMATVMGTTKIALLNNIVRNWEEMYDEEIRGYKEQFVKDLMG